MSIPRIADYEMPARLLWPVNRVDWRPDPARTVLLIHDMQDYFRDFFAADSQLVNDVVNHLLRLRDACDQAGVPVVYTAQPGQQSPAERGLLQPWWGPGITAMPEGERVVAALAPRAHDTVLDKWRYSAFARSDLQERMQAWGRDQLVICGIYAHIGCMTTAVDAFMRDIQVFFVADAVADFSLAQHSMALEWVAGRCGVVTGTDDVCSALAGEENFPVPETPDALREQVAALLQMPVSDLWPEDDLLLMGLDSIRLMRLVEAWKRAGLDIGFVALAEQPTLSGWWSCLQAART